MKKALALILALVMLCATLVPVASATTPATINLQEFYADHGYASTYVGKALSETDAKPQQDGVIGDNEYQKCYLVGANGKTSFGAHDSIRSGVQQPLINEYKEYVSHDAEWIYIGFDFYSGDSNGVRLYWNLSIINSFDFTYNGGSTVNAAFTQNGRGIADGLNLYLRETAQYASGTTAGTGVTAPTSQELVVGTSGETDTVSTNANANMHLTYEIKISKTWYANQLGIKAEDVVNVAWTTLGSKINSSASSYTQIGHYITDTELADLKTTYGATYTRPTASSHPYDNAVLPRLLILDDEPAQPDYSINLQEFYADHGYASTYVGKALSETDAKPQQDGVIGDNEYQKCYLVGANGKTSFGAHDSIRSGVQQPLINEYKEYVSHDAEWIYIGFDFYSGDSNGVRLYWNLSIINSFDFTYNGGSTVNAAFTQNGRGIADGLNLYLRETAQYASGTTAGTGVTAPTSQELVVGTSGETDTVSTNANANMHLTYEIKISKTWYANQLGIKAEDVVNVAWTTLGSKINSSASSYTQIGHYITDTELADLKTTYGVDYTRPTAASHPYDNAVLPRLLILDEQNTDWEAFADQQELTVKVKPVTEVPVIDGVIGATEYPTTRTTNVADLYKGDGQTQVEGTEIKEYFGHDAEYVYYALSFKQTSNGSNGLACIMNFKPTNTFDVFNNSYAARSRYQARYNEDKDGNTVNFTNGLDTANGATWAATVDEIDMFFAAEKDRETNIKTYEFKISKKYIATIAGVELDDVKVVPYYVSFHDACMLGGTFTSDLKAALAVAGGSAPTMDIPCYTFMSLEDGDILKIEDRLAINTQEEASIRLSPNNSGLRFKSVVSTVELKALMTKYDYIKVGTLIAPEDFGLDLSTVIDNTDLVAGTNYIDVEADVANPFGHDKNINVFAGSITNFKGNNAGRTFEALGYIAYSADGVNWTYVYSETTAFRSAAYVAQEAINSGDYDDDTAALAILNAYAAVTYEAN